MWFFGLFVLVVLPIFLYYCIGSLKRNPDFKDNPGTGFIIVILYLFGGMAILADLLIVAHLIKLI